MPRRVDGDEQPDSTGGPADPDLTEREGEVFALMVTGATNQAIAWALHERRRLYQIPD